jgi:hypothetical protein
MRVRAMAVLCVPLPPSPCAVSLFLAADVQHWGLLLVLKQGSKRAGVEYC